MIGKVGTGASFGGLTDYLIGEKKLNPEIIGYDGVDLYGPDGIEPYSKEDITESFNLQRKLNPKLTKAVFHASLSWAEGETVSNDVMVDVAHRYMKDLGIENTQYLLVRHNDTDKNHLHIMANRVNYDGKTISDSFDKYKSFSSMQRIEKDFGFVVAKDQEPKRKTEIKKAILSTIEKKGDIQDVFQAIRKLKYEVVENKSKDGKTTSGVSYRHENGTVFKASQIDRKLSYNKMLALIDKEKSKSQSKSRTKPSKNKGFDMGMG